MRKNRTRVRCSTEERRRIVNRSYQTEENLKTFCEREGVAFSTLQYWRKRQRDELGLVPARLKAESGGRSPLSFVEVPNGGSSHRWEMELVLPNGSMMRFRGEGA